jgi:ankyrin repeat protein
VEMVRQLIDKGASVTGDLEGYTPTELAKKYGEEAVYQLLVSRGGLPVNSRVSAQIALIEAASNGDVEGMQSAINKGAKINDVDVSKQTALVAAVREPIYRPSQGAAIWWLLDHGADPNLKGESNYRDLDGVPLHILVAMNTHTFERPDIMPLVEETLQRMLAAGAKVSATDSVDRTPLHIAAKNNNLRAAEILIREGAKVMPKDKIGKTPLDYAESAAMIKLLKQNGATER